jgi:hypothetical protein
MRKMILAFALAASSIVPAAADMFDDRLVKAQQSVANAQKRLEAARACVENKPACIEVEKQRAEKTAQRAAKQLADLAAVQQ